MARRFKRAKRIRKKKSFKKSKRASKSTSKSFAMKVLDVLSPPKRTQKTFDSSIRSTFNEKVYIDLAQFDNAPNAFMSYDHLVKCISAADRLNQTTWTLDQEWYVKSATRKYEFTNISNSIIYFTLNEFVPKHDLQITQGSPFVGGDGITGFIDRTLGNPVYFPDNAVVATDLLGTFSADGYYASQMVYEHALKHPQVRSAIRSAFFPKYGKEIALQPQQSILFSQSHRKSFLFAPKRHILSSGGAFASDYKGVTKRLIATMTGQTARATGSAGLPFPGVNTYVNAANCLLHVTCMDYVTVQLRTSYLPVNEVAISHGSQYLAAPNQIYEFGENNNAPVANA